MDPSTGSSWRTFRFLRRIGKGGFGEVYLAEMSTGGGFAKPVAVKVLREDYLEDEEIVRRLRDEARLLGQLSHPNIVMADDLVTLAGRISVVMEYVPGANLNWVINPKVYPDTLPPTVVCQVISQVAEALEAAWSRPSTLTGEPLRVLHRDIKPSNIRLTPDGVVKVLDFGVARADMNDRESDTQDLRMGSVPYMAPEVLLDLPYSTASDIYALGVTFYELAARRRFGKCRLQQVQHEALIHERFLQANLTEFLLAAEEVEDLLRMMLHWEPDMRPGILEVIHRCRDLERRSVGPRVKEWAPSIIPLVVRRVGTDQTVGELIGQTLIESSSSVGNAHDQAEGFGAGGFLDEEDPPTEETEAPRVVTPPVLGALLPPTVVSQPAPEHGVGGRGRLVGGVALLFLVTAVISAIFLMPGLERGTETEIVGAVPSEEEPADKAPVLATEAPSPEPESLSEGPGDPVPVEVKPKPVRRAPSKPRTKPVSAEPVPEPETTETPAEPVVAAPPSAATKPTPEASPEPPVASEPAPVAPTATAITQEIALSSKPLGVSVSVDGVYRGTTPLRVSLTVGSHKLAYEGPDGTRYKTVQVVAGERQVIVYDQSKDVIR